MKKLLSGVLSAVVFVGYISSGLGLNTNTLMAEETENAVVTTTQSQNTSAAVSTTASSAATTKAPTVTTVVTTKAPAVTTAVSTTKAPAVTTAVATTKAPAVTTAVTTTKAPAATTAVSTTKAVTTTKTVTTTKAPAVTTAAPAVTTKAVTSQTTGVFNYLKEDFFIKSHPQDVSKEVDTLVSFSVKVNGENLSYQWQYLPEDGDSWENIPISDIESAGTNTLTLLAIPKRNGNRYRCVMSGVYGYLITRSAKLTVVYPDLIIEHPKDQTVDVDNPATFSVKTNAENPTFQWQVSNNKGATWEDILPDNNSTADDADLVVTALPKNDGAKYRCKVTAGSNKQTSGEAELTVNFPKIIIKQPSDAVLGIPDTTFDVETTRDDVSYQWQKSTDGENWNDIDKDKVPSAATPELDLPSGEIEPDAEYRVVVKVGNNSETSEPAKSIGIERIDFIPEKFELDEESAKLLKKFYYSYDHEFDLSNLKGTAYIQITYKEPINENGDLKSDYIAYPITSENITLPIDENTNEQITPRSVYYLQKNRDLPYQTALICNDTYQGYQITNKIAGYIDSFIDERGDYSLDHNVNPEDSTYILKFYNLYSMVSIGMASTGDLEEFKNNMLSKYPDIDNVTLYEFERFIADIDKSGEADKSKFPFDPADGTYILRYYNLITKDYLDGISWTDETIADGIEQKWDSLLNK